MLQQNSPNRQNTPDLYQAEDAADGASEFFNHLGRVLGVPKPNQHNFFMCLCAMRI